MRARSYHLWLVLACAKIHHSHQRPTFLRAAGEAAEGVHVPGSSSTLDLGPLENISAERAIDVPSTSDKKGKGLLCGVLGCFNGPKAQDIQPPPNVHPAIENLPIEHKLRYLQAVRSNSLESRPRARDVLEMYKTGRKGDRDALIQTAFQKLLNARGLSQIEVGTWVDLFTLMVKDGKTQLQEGSNILFGFHSLWTKHARDEKVSQYLQAAIQVSENKLLNKLPLEQVNGPWIREILNPAAGPSKQLSTFEEFKKLLDWDNKITRYFPSIHDPSTAKLKDLKELENLIKKDTQGVIAQSKTAGAILLYHMSQLGDRHLSKLAKESISNLQKDKSNLFKHDAELIDYISKQLRNSASTSTPQK